MEILENVNEVVGEAIDGTADGVRKVSRVVFREMSITVMIITMIVFILGSVAGGISEILNNNNYVLGWLLITVVPIIIIVPFAYLLNTSPKAIFNTSGIHYRSKRINIFMTWGEVMDIKIESKRHNPIVHICSFRQKIILNTFFSIRHGDLKRKLLLFCPRQDLKQKINHILPG